MKKLLIITQDEINNEQNKGLFCESIDFCKNIASKPDLSYTQLACFEYQNGLLEKLISTYLDNSTRNVNIIFDSPNNISTFNKLFPKKHEQQIYKEIFTAKNGISVSNIRKMSPLKDYNSRINISYNFNNAIESICNNFNYVILHHGGSDLLYYFTALNRLLSSNDEQTNLKKVILVSKNHLFDNLIEQYKTFSRFGIEKSNLYKNIRVVDCLSNCIELLEEDIIYTPHSSNTPFTID